MKGYKWWAKQYAQATQKQDDPFKKQDPVNIAYDWEQGFKAGREHAASLIESFQNPKFNGTALLIRAIGEGEYHG